jgi:hypothetical protein
MSLQAQATRLQAQESDFRRRGILTPRSNRASRVSGRAALQRPWSRAHQVMSLKALIGRIPAPGSPPGASAAPAGQPGRPRRGTAAGLSGRGARCPCCPLCRRSCGESRAPETRAPTASLVARRTAADRPGPTVGPRSSQRCLQVRSIAGTIASLHSRPQRCMQGSSRSGRYGDGRTRGRGGTRGSVTCDSSSPRNVSLRSTATEGDESAECAGASSSARAVSAAGGPPRALRSLCGPGLRKFLSKRYDERCKD